MNVDPVESCKDVTLGVIDFSAYGSVKVFFIWTGLRIFKMFYISFIIKNCIKIQS